MELARVLSKIADDPILWGIHSAQTISPKVTHQSESQRISVKQPSSVFFHASRRSGVARLFPLQTERLDSRQEGGRLHAEQGGGAVVSENFATGLRECGGETFALALF